MNRFGEEAVDVAVMPGVLGMPGFVPGSLSVPPAVIYFVRAGVGSLRDAPTSYA
ncbi:MAG: hypothetical protein ACI9BK_002603 [Acidimicrobiales bacterium]